MIKFNPLWTATPEISLSATVVDIGDVTVGSSGTGTFDIINEGGAALVVSGISSDNPAFPVSPSSEAIPPGQTRTVTITFTPGSTGSQSATITIVSNDSDEGTLTVSVTGNGVPSLVPEISLSATVVDIGDVTVGSSGTGTFNITNEGGADLVVSGISSDNPVFPVSPSSETIPPGQT
ncbi:MAG TPA: choice-of-anchor D domain-containing protein, partial [archaeon]|nr:choice-of-anchor D domain-containing protein [archaeon]